MQHDKIEIVGLTTVEVNEARLKYGNNTLMYKKDKRFLTTILGIIKEPMVLLLLAASTIYFITGQTSDGIFMVFAIILITAISLYQDTRSHNALEKLKDLTRPLCRVVRDGKEIEISSTDLVVGDYMIIEEGKNIIADGIIIQSNDFSVNQSVLTGESLAVFKDKDNEDNKVFAGSVVVTGLAIVCVTAIGNETGIGKIGSSMQDIPEEKTPLEVQINSFVKKMVVLGAFVFLLVWIINFISTKNYIGSLLKALTLAMSLLPEEIPVAFTTFMALGAWRLMKRGIIVKQMKTVETLGSATVICTDKTGTITQNNMSLAKIYVPSRKPIFYNSNNQLDTEEQEVITTAMWASEPMPFDPMEAALHQAYEKFAAKDERQIFRMIHEYPLGGKPPMMTHIFKDKDSRMIIAAKGAPEAIMEVSDIKESERKQFEKIMSELAAEGYRVLGVGAGQVSNGTFPKTQQEIKFVFKGFVAFYDPPKENISRVLQNFYKAGINVKIITGDNALTTIAIARQIGFKGYDKAMQGDELMQLGDMELKLAVMDINIFSRMFPEAKLRIVNALKANDQIVAMVGDGVNDGPALKAAHIGIAMGKKGTAIAKDAASLICVEDDLEKMVDAIAMGRKIYSNLKKAVQYIISIHIPIILVVLIPLGLGLKYPDIFTPLHVIILELIMGPTCSMVYENEPLEANIMNTNPRSFTTSFFTGKELFTSIIQGLVIASGTLAMYQFSVYLGYNEYTVRAMVFTTLMIANIFLTEVNRSFYYSIFKTIRYKNKTVVYIIAVSLSALVLLLYIPVVAQMFRFEALSSLQLALCITVGAFSTLWYEGIKWLKRSRYNLNF